MRSCRSWAERAETRFLAPEMLSRLPLGVRPSSLRSVYLVRITFEVAGEHEHHQFDRRHGHPGRMARSLQLFGWEGRGALLRGTQRSQDSCHALLEIWHRLPTAAGVLRTLFRTLR